MTTVEAFLFALVTCILAYLYRSRSRSKRSPPGPRPIPLLGNALQVGKSPHFTFVRWAKEYGPIVQFKLGTQSWLLVSDADLIEELYNHPNATGKDTGPVFFQAHLGYGLSFGHGPVAEAHRKFTIETLNALRLKKGCWEDRILRNVDILMKTLQHWENHPVFGDRIFFDASFNTLWSILSGHKQDWSEGCSELGKMGDQIMATLSQVCRNGLLAFPWLRYIFPEKLCWNRWVEHNNQLRAMCETCIDEHQAGGQFKQLLDFTDYYLSKYATNEDPKSPFYGDLGRKNLVSDMLGIFFPGQITATVLAWALLYVSQHPSVQTKLQNEIDANICGTTKPNLELRHKMPYVKAILSETLRLSSAPSTGNPHRLLEDMEFNGYFLKKDTMIAPNHFWVNHDPDIWGIRKYSDPNVFLKESTKSFSPFRWVRKCVLVRNWRWMQCFCIWLLFLKSLL